MMPLGTGAVCLALAGCVSIGHVDLADDQIMPQIKVGESTMQQVVGLLGGAGQPARDGTRRSEEGMVVL